MELKKKHRLRFVMNKSLLSLFYLFFIISFKTSTSLGIRSCQSSVKADFSLQEIENKKDPSELKNIYMGQQLDWDRVVARRLLSGPGSSPPRCTANCGKCKPCKPVLVPVPPGTPVTAEYYPEAWRCKCGNKLYMPRSR